MKKLTKILVLLVSVALLACAFILVASAEESDPYAKYKYDPSVVAFAVYPSETEFKADKAANNDYANAIGKYNYLSDALKATGSSKKYVAMIADWECGEKGMPINNSSFGLNTTGMTFDLNGHTLSFSVYTGYYKSDGASRSTAYTWLTIGASNVTIVGNGGTIQGVMSLIQNSGSRTLNIVGGEGGITFRSIVGKQVTRAGTADTGYTYTWSDYVSDGVPSYSGTQMIKIGQETWTASNAVTSKLNISGKVSFERLNEKNTSALKYSGTAVINVGTADGARTTFSFKDASGSAGTGTEAQTAGIFYLRTHTGMNSESTAPNAVYNEGAVCSKLNLVNTDFDILSEKLFAADLAFRLVGEDDIQYVNIDDCNIYATDYTKDSAGNTVSRARVYGLFMYDRAANVRLVANDSRFEIIRDIKLLNCNYYSKYTAIPGYALFKNCYIKCVDGTAPYRFLRNTGTVVFEDCHLEYGYHFTNTGGTAWAPYDATKTPTAIGGKWPDYAEALGGVGTLIKEGCTIPTKVYGSDNLGTLDIETDAAEIGAYVTMEQGANTVTTKGSEHMLVEIYDADLDKNVRLVTTEEHLASLYCDVNWYDEKGEKIATSAYNNGDTIELPDVNMTKVTNGWYMTEYKWVDGDGKDVVAGQKVTGDMRVYMTPKNYVANLNVASYALRLMTHIEYEFYIPKAAFAEGISNVRVGDRLGVEKVIDDVEYVKINTGVYSGAMEFETAKTVDVTFDYTDANGKVHTLTSSFDVSVDNYVSYIIANRDSYAEETILVADLLQYHVELYKALYPTADVTATRIYKLFTEVEEYSIFLDSMIFNKKDGLTACDNLNSIVDSIQFVANGYASGFQLNIKDSKDTGIKVDGVQFLVRGYLAEADYEKGINAGTVAYGIRTAEGEFSKNADGSYTMVRSSEIPIYNITSDEINIVLTVTDAEGKTSTVSGTYSFDAYCQSVVEKYPTDAIIPFLKAVKAYSISAAEYRFGGTKYFPDGKEVASESMISVDKVADHTVANTVNPGDNVTYTITVENKGKTETVTVVSDVVPENTTYVEGADSYADGILTWNVSLAAGEKKTVSYTVKVDNDVALIGTTLEGTITRAGSTRCFGKALYVERTLNAVDTEYIDIAIAALADSTYENLNLARWIYYVAYSNGSVSTQLTSTAAPASIIEGIATATAKAEVLRMVAPTLFGGYGMPTTIEGVKGTAAGKVDEADLVAGDFIFVQGEEETLLYIYGNKGLFLLTKGAVKADKAAVLESLEGAKKFVVLRPSITMTSFTPTDMDAERDVLNEKQRALIETAKAYVLRGEYTQYDDTSMASGGYTRAENSVRAPEDYNRNEWGYLNCAYFTQEVYYSTFNYSIGMNTTNALTNQSAGKGMKVWSFSRTPGTQHSETEMAEVTEQFTSCLEPGDLVVIVRDKADGYGHVMLYIGDGNLIHSSGSNFDYTYDTGYGKETYEPTIRYLRLKDYFLTPSNDNGYIFGGRVAVLTVVRPLQNSTLANKAIPENTLNRVNNLAGIKVEKFSNYNEAKTVGRGDSITYTFAIRNTNDVAVTLDITDVVPAYTYYVDGAQSKDGDNLSWTVTVPANDDVSVSYTVKVSDVAEYGKYIDNSKAKIAGVRVTCKDTKIERTFSSEQEKAIIDTVTAMRKEGTSLKGLALVNEIYKRALGIDYDVFESTDAAVVAEGDDGVFIYGAFRDDKSGFYLREGSKYGEMLIPTLYGGRKYLERSAEKWTQTRLGQLHHLVVGDVVIGRMSSSTAIYMYAGGDKFLVLTNGFADDSSLAKTRFERFLGYANYYCILRPSMVMDGIAD